MFKYGLNVRWYFGTIIFLAVIMVLEVCRAVSLFLNEECHDVYNLFSNAFYTQI